MTTRIGAVVEVNAETEEAQRDLRRFGRTVDAAADDLDRLGDEGREMGRRVEAGFDRATDGAREYSRASRAAEAAQTKFNESLREFALGFVTIQAAIAGARMAFEALRRGFETYAETSESAAAAQARFTEQVERLNVAFAEAVFGGGGAEAVMSELTEATSRLTASMGEGDGAVRRMSDAMLGLVVAANDSAAAMDRLDANTGGAITTFTDYIPITMMVRYVENLGTEAREAAYQASQLDTAISDLEDTINASPGLVSLRLIPGVDPFDADSITLPEPEPIAAPVSVAADEGETGIQRQERHLSTIEQIMREGRERAEAETAAHLERMAALEDEANARTREKIEAEAEYASKMQAFEAEQAIANSEKIKAAYNARVAAAQDYATAVGSVVQQVAGGQAKALDAIKALIGQELIAKGQARLLEAAAMFFVPGQQGFAVGLTAASVAMIAAGAALSKSGGGGGGGGSAVGAGVAPAPAVAQPAQRTDVTVISNFGVVGDPREAARVVADSVRTATREGYL